ncbi:MAG: hypothetical protein ABSE70_06210 [Candidatus Limnocylindrales bacterium]
MNADERIEAALKRRPSDERTYDEPLAAPVKGDAHVLRVRPLMRSRMRTGALPALAAVAIVLAVGAGGLAVGLLRGPSAGHPSGSGTANDYELTGRISCFGQAPGAFTPGPDLFPSDFGCPMMAVPPAGYDAARWTLDPALPYSAGATELHVLVEWVACHSFESAEGRVVQNVQYRDGEVVVTLAVRSLEGFATCPGTPPTPVTIKLAQPVGYRDLFDGGSWPSTLIVHAGQLMVTPSPTPYPLLWHPPIECTGEADGPGSFKAASMGTDFGVYCAVLPAGWQRVSMAGDESGTTLLSATYRGPAGEELTLLEGKICQGTLAECQAGTPIGTAMFGNLEGVLVNGLDDADFAVYFDAGENPSWIATGKGMSQEAFTALTAALIMVAK